MWPIRWPYPWGAAPASPPAEKLARFIPAYKTASYKATFTPGWSVLALGTVLSAATATAITATGFTPRITVTIT